MALSGNGRLRHPLREVQHNQRPNLDSFSGAGLSSRLKTGQAPGASGSFVSSAGPQGKLRLYCPSGSLALIMVPFQLHDDRALLELTSTEGFDSRRTCTLWWRFDLSPQ